MEKEDNNLENKLIIDNAEASENSSKQGFVVEWNPSINKNKKSHENHFSLARQKRLSKRKSAYSRQESIESQRSGEGSSARGKNFKFHSRS